MMGYCWMMVHDGILLGWWMMGYCWMMVDDGILLGDGG